METKEIIVFLIHVFYLALGVYHCAYNFMITGNYAWLLAMVLFGLIWAWAELNS